MAGTIKTNIQLGDSATATQNFSLTAASADGTMKLARGNAGATTQDILTVDAAGKITPSQGFATSYMPLGIGQTIQSNATLVPARTLAGGPYTNATGRPIFISITVINSTTTAFGFQLNIDGVGFSYSYVDNASATGNRTVNLTAIIPIGSTYQTVGVTAATLQAWKELST